MKTIGFIEDHDLKAVQREFLDDNEEVKAFLINERERNRIVDYLNNSEIVYSVTWALYDGETYIAPYMLFSDGEWIWTSHFAYYLTKLNFSRLTNEFLNHLRARDYKISPLSKDQRTSIDIFIHLKLLNMSEKERESMRRNLIKLGYDVSKIEGSKKSV